VEQAAGNTKIGDKQQYSEGNIFHFQKSLCVDVVMGLACGECPFSSKFNGVSNECSDCLAL
jgi:hypothetical protein